MIDLDQLCLDFRISAKRSRRGWIHLNCPFCGDSMGHLGFNLSKEYFFCFRCGWHPNDAAVSALTKLDLKAARQLIARYKMEDSIDREKSPDPAVRPDRIKWPEGCGHMATEHTRYLEDRRFDSISLESEWGLLGTQNWGRYGFRVIAPIEFRGEVVSWQGRDITGKQQAKYLPCPAEDEVLSHKQVLYGFDKALRVSKGGTVVVVEGITGVWRLGPGAVATFGVQFTSSQILLLVKHFQKALIFNDGDDAGQRQAEKMATEIAAAGDIEVELLEPVGCDSGDVPDDIAQEIMEEVRTG